MYISVFDTVRPFKGHITSNWFDGNYICDGISAIGVDSEFYATRRSYRINEIGDLGLTHNGIYIMFDEIDGEIYVSTHNLSPRIIKIFPNKLVFEVESVEYFISFGS